MEVVMSNVPKLRFKEFTDEWISIPLGETDIKLKRGPFGSALKKSMFVPKADDTYKVYEQKHPIQKNLAVGNYYVSEADFQSLKGFEVAEDDYLMSCSGTIGEVVQVTRPFEKGLINQALLRIRLGSMFNQQFFFFAFRRNVNQLETKGSGIKNLGSLAFLRNEFFVPIPTLTEQQKIAAFLTAVDTKVEQLTEKETLLKQYKKGVMQKIFSQEIRFKADKLRNGTIKDFGYFYYGKSAPKSSVTADAHTPVIRYGELYSTYKEEVHEIKSKTNLPDKDLKFSKGGEVLVPRVGEDPRDFNKCSYLPMAGVAIGEMISVYNTDENGLYMSYLFNSSMQKSFARVVEGGNVSNLYFRYLEDIELTIHSREEQSLIVQFLKAIDVRINLVSRQLSTAKNFKKGLLQQMFV